MESAETKIVVENKAPSPTPSIPVPAATPVAPIPAPLPPPIAAAAPVTPVAPLPSSEQAPEPASKGSDKKNKTLENVAAKQPSSDKGQVVPNQPPKTNEPPPPAKSGSSKERQSMTKENNPQFDTLVLDVAHIIFGDNAPDINVRLVRMALEQVWKNRSELQSLDAIAREIARIIFGETSTSDLNVRLVKMALERSNSIALFKAA